MYSVRRMTSTDAGQSRTLTVNKQGLDPGGGFESYDTPQPSLLFLLSPNRPATNRHEHVDHPASASSDHTPSPACVTSCPRHLSRKRQIRPKAMSCTCAATSAPCSGTEMHSQSPDKAGSTEAQVSVAGSEERADTGFDTTDEVDDDGGENDDARFLRDLEERRNLQRVELRVVIEIHTELHD